MINNVKTVKDINLKVYRQSKKDETLLFQRMVEKYIKLGV